MAPFLSLFIFFFFFFFFFTFHIFTSFSQIPNAALFFTVNKDVSTLQYTTQIYMGSPRLPHKFVLHLGGPFLWADCSSTSPKPIKSGSLHCSMANSCNLNPENTVTKMVASGELVEEIMTVNYVDSLKSKSITTVRQFLFSCAPNALLRGLASGAKGMLGLGRTKISLPSQLSNTFGFRRKFSICLSGSDGAIFSGDETLLPGGTGIYNSLVYTPLISKSGSEEEYYINVKSVKISGKKLGLGKKFLQAKLSTVVPYTTMDSKTYVVFVKAFVMAAISMNMTRVISAPAVPFGVCFGSKNTAAGGYVAPTIELVLQSEMVKWKIDSRNSMVKVSDEVNCLGIMDGGSNPENSIIIGGYQLEDNLLEFDLGRSMLGFSSSTCSNFNLYSNSVV